MDRLPEKIEAEGLLLRRWTPADAEALARAVEENVEHLRPWMRWAAEEPRSVQGRRALLTTWEREWEGGGDAYLGVFLDGTVAGSCGLHRRRGPRALEIGYWTHVSFLRRGVAMRVAAALVDGAFSVPGIEWVEIHHDKANVASAAVARGLGFRCVGERPDTPEAPAEVGIDCAWRVEREEWLARRRAGPGHRHRTTGRSRTFIH